MAGPVVLGRALDDLRGLQPSAVLSSHLPPIQHCLDRAADTLRAAPTTPPVPGVSQAEVEALLASMEPIKETADVR
jgi:hypothetical protein